MSDPTIKNDPMIYLSGIIKPYIVEASYNRHDIGMLLTPDMGNAPDLAFLRWAADNGCFTQPHKYTDERFLAWLEKKNTERDGGYAEFCLFANAPDVVHWVDGRPVGDPVATLERSAPMLPKIRALGYRASIVAQDGLENCQIPWDDFDALFIGGSDEWKLGPAARNIVAEACRRNKWIHMGRVNSLKRLNYAAAIGCDSADGTFLQRMPTENMYRLGRWLDEINGGQLSLNLSLYTRKRKAKVAA